MARDQGLGLMCYSPLAIGLLTGQFRKGAKPPTNSPWGKNPRSGLSSQFYPFDEAMTEQLDHIVQVLTDVGKKNEKTPIPNLQIHQRLGSGKLMDLD